MNEDERFQRFRQLSTVMSLTHLAGWLVGGLVGWRGKVAPAGGEVSCHLILVPAGWREVWWIPREVRCHRMRIPGRFRASAQLRNLRTERGSVPPAT